MKTVVLEICGCCLGNNEITSLEAGYNNWPVSIEQGLSAELRREIYQNQHDYINGRKAEIRCDDIITVDGHSELVNPVFVRFC